MGKRQRGVTGSHSLISWEINAHPMSNGNHHRGIACCFFQVDSFCGTWASPPPPSLCGGIAFIIWVIETLILRHVTVSKYRLTCLVFTTPLAGFPRLHQMSYLDAQRHFQDAACETSLHHRSARIDLPSTVCLGEGREAAINYRANCNQSPGNKSPRGGLLTTIIKNIVSLLFRSQPLQRLIPLENNNWETIYKILHLRYQNENQKNSSVHLFLNL